MTNKSKVIDGVQHKQCSKCKRFKPTDVFSTILIQFDKSCIQCSYRRYC